MKITQNLTTINYTKYKNRPIKYLVIHYFGALGSAKDTCAYFKSVDRRSSAHYFVDDAGVYQAVKDEDAAWHCADFGNGPYKKLCLNYNSIGIEVRPYKVNSKTKSAADKDWYFHDKTIDNTIELVKELMANYNIDSDHVIRHWDVTTKWCPRPFVGDDINTYYGKSGNQLWLEFKQRISEEETEVTQEEFDAKMEVYLAKQKDLPPAAWSKEEREWAEANNLIVGDPKGNKQYKSFLTREQMVQFMKNIFDFIKTGEVK